MARQKQIGWNRFTATALVSVVMFVATLVSAFAPALVSAQSTLNTNGSAPTLGGSSSTNASGVQLGSTSPYPSSFAWKSSTTIQGQTLAINQPGINTKPVFTCVEDPNITGSYTCTAPSPLQFGGCQMKILVGGTLVSSLGQGTFQTFTNAPTCTQTGINQVIKIADADKYSPICDGQTGSNDQCSSADGQSGSTGTLDPNLQCNVEINPLTWILCPLVNGINNGLNALDQAITSMLTIDQDKIFNTAQDPGKGYYSAWQTFRGFALAFLILSGLAMVIAQGLGFQALDAYTIKKILPRLIFAIIGIALSWEIMKFFVVLTNDLGTGIRQIIYYPFRNMGGAVELGTGAQLLANILGAAALTALGIVGLLSFVATAALAIGVAFLVLILRQLVIIVLVLFAPIAIACSILPNTQNVYKLWYESFSKALMMFPIIVAFLAIGRVFAVASIGADIGKATAISQLIAFAAYIMPYFLIPLTFRFAGGALRTLGGAINDRNRGAFDRLKKFRGNRTAKNMHDLKTGNRIKSTNPLANRFNRTTAAIGAMPNAGVNPLKMKSRLRAFQSNEGMLSAGEYGEKNHHFQAIKQNDDFLNAGLHAKGSESKAAEYLRGKGYDERTISTAVGNIRAARRDTSDEVFEIASAMALPATGTAFRGGAGEMHDQINEVAGNDRVLAGRMLAGMRAGATQARRFDLAGGGFGDQINTLNAQHKGEMTTAQANRHIFEASLEGQGGGYIAGARRNAVENMAPVMLEQLDGHVRGGNENDIAQNLAVLAGRYDAMQSVAPENAKVLADQVLSQKITSATGNARFTHEDGTVMNVREMIESYRGDENFLNMRRELAGSDRERARQAQLYGQQGPQQPPNMGPPIIPQ